MLITIWPIDNSKNVWRFSTGSDTLGDRYRGYIHRLDDDLNELAIGGVERYRGTVWRRPSRSAALTGLSRSVLAAAYAMQGKLEPVPLLDGVDFRNAKIAELYPILADVRRQLSSRNGRLDLTQAQLDAVIQQRDNLRAELAAERETSAQLRLHIQDVQAAMTRTQEALAALKVRVAAVYASMGNEQTK
jgi:hypothetical protein